MKKLIFILLSLIFIISSASISYAYLSIPWTMSGVSVCVQSVPMSLPQIAVDSTGSAVIAWTDTRAGNNDIYGQKISSSGAYNWQNNGKPLITGAAYQNIVSTLPNGSNGTIIIWSETNPTGTQEIRAQLVNSNGDPQWGANGQPVCTAEGSKMYISAVSDGAGGALVTWVDGTVAPMTAYAQKINSNGLRQWYYRGVRLSSSNKYQYYPHIATNGAGGAVIAWVDTPLSGDYRLCVQRIGSGGFITWGTNGIEIYQTSNILFPKILGLGSEKTIVCWEDNPGGISSMNIYAQKLDALGNKEWATGGNIICSASGYKDNVRIVSDGAGGAILSWDDNRVNNLDIYAQRVDGDGSIHAGWPAGGLSICIATGHQNMNQMVADGSGGAVITWNDLRTGMFDIYAQNINGNGYAYWGANGKLVCTGGSFRQYPQIAADGSGGAVIAWQDHRNGNDYDIYAERMTELPATGTVINQRTGVSYSMIQSALNAADTIAGDTLDCSGTFHEFNIQWPNKNNIILHGTSSTDTVINADYFGRVIDIRDPVSVTIEGFTLKNGLITGNGGAIQVITGAKLSLFNDNFTNNTCSGRSGAIQVNTLLGLTAKNCTFSGNRAGEAGAIGSSAGILLIPMNISDCTFVQNYAGYGGVFDFCTIGSLVRCSFISNEAGNSGGVANFCFGRTIVSDCSFINNRAAQNAGVSYYNDWRVTNSSFIGNTGNFGSVAYYGTWEAINCLFQKNTGLQTGVFQSLDLKLVSGCSFISNEANGGAVAHSCVSRSIIENSSFIGNHASNAVGVAYMCQWKVSNCTFEGNSAFYHSGVAQLCSFEVTDSIFENNSVQGNNSWGGVVREGWWSAKNCIFRNNRSQYCGGVAYYMTEFNATGCTFTNNYAANSGGCMSSGFYRCMNSTFEANKATLSGAVFNAANVHALNCTFTGNTFEATNGSGTVFSGGTAVVTGCAFSSNYGYNGGVAAGPMYLNAYDCTFMNNKAQFGSVFYYGTFTTERCKFLNNIATGAGGIGYYGTQDMTNCLLAYNSVPSQGSVGYMGIWTLKNCTLHKNPSVGNGGMFYSISAFNATNCIFSGSTHALDYASGLLSYCAAPYLGTYSGGTSNFLTVPDFKYITTSETSPYAFHLRKRSPCTYSGTTVGAPADDILGRPRPAGKCSIGAYEYVDITPEIYVAYEGNDMNDGTFDKPLRTLQRGLDLVGTSESIIIKSEGLYFGPVKNWPNIQDITLRSIKSTWEGIVASVSDQSRVFDLSAVQPNIRGTILGITIKGGNTTEAGGGVKFPANSNIVLKNCLIKDNQASAGGGILYGTAIDCVFQSNKSTVGGGAGAYNSVLKGCTFTGNQSSGPAETNLGGGAYDCLVERCSFFDNTAGKGGGLYTDRVDDYILNCVFDGNTDCGIYKDADTTLSVINCTLHDNIPIHTALGVTKIRNSIIYGGTMVQDAQATNMAYYSDIQNAGTFSDPQNSCISADPGFIAAGSRDFKLNKTSPAVNSGSANEAPSYDRDSNLRPIDNLFDMGAYEFTEYGVTLKTPNSSGIKIEAGSYYTITWDVKDFLGNTASANFTTLYYSTNSGATWATIEANIPGGGKSYSWAAPSLLSDKCRIAVEIAKESGKPISRDVSYFDISIIDSMPPAIKVSAVPQYIGAPFMISWEARDPLILSAPVTLELTTNNGSTWSIIAASRPTMDSYTYTPPADTNIDYPFCAFRITARDIAGNTSTEVFTFGIDTKVPSMQVTMSGSAATKNVPVIVDAQDERGINRIRIKAGETAPWLEYPLADVPAKITIVPASNGLHKVTFEAYDLSGNLTRETRVIDLAMQLTPEVADIIVDNINVSHLQYIAKNASIKAFVYDYQSDLDKVFITVKTSGGDFRYPTTTVLSTNDATLYTASVLSNLTFDAKSFSIMVEAIDINGNISTLETAPLKATSSPTLTQPAKNVPNPFRPGHGESTTIIYKLSQDASVKFIMYDITGKAVYSRNFNPGDNGGRGPYQDNEITWDGRMDSGSYAPNGVYIYFITTGGKVIGKGQLTVLD